MLSGLEVLAGLGLLLVLGELAAYRLLPGLSIVLDPVCAASRSPLAWCPAPPWQVC